MNARERIIVALDVDKKVDALKLVRQLRGQVGCFKIGSQLYTAEGPQIVEEIVSLGEKVFLDLKFHDIPNTVEKAARRVCELGVAMFTLHTSGGSKMMKAAVDAVTGCHAAPPALILGVTVLTSLGQEDLAEVGIPVPLPEQVLRLADLARHCGIGGLVASPQEVAAIRARVGSGMKIVTPGIRPSGAGINDQNRIATPTVAIRSGADYLVVGRPITASPDPAGSAERIAAEIAGAI